MKRARPRTSKEEAKSKIKNDPDFVALPHHQNSLRAVVKRYPDAVPTHIIARGLMMSEHQLRAIWVNVIMKLRKAMKIV